MGTKLGGLKSVLHPLSVNSPSVYLLIVEGSNFGETGLLKM